MSDLIPATAGPLLGEEEINAIMRVARSGILAQGPEVAAFEREFADHFKLDRACVAVNSGTAGLHLGLLAAGVGPNDEVIVPSFTFAATANSVALTGATPVFADIDPDTFCLSPSAVEAVITDRTVGIMPVHMYGHPAQMVLFDQIARRYGLQLFEDAAPAHGASILGQPVGSFGSFAVFSLYATKNMTAGEGGMVTTATPAIGRSLRLLRNQGMLTQYQNEIVGFNARMSELHAAIGREQLLRVDAWTQTRQENASFLTKNLEGVSPPRVEAGAVHVYNQYTVRIADDRDGFAKALRSEFQIATGLYYPVPCHRLPPFRADNHLPETDLAAEQCLSLPVHPVLKHRDLERIVSAVNTLARAGS